MKKHHAIAAIVAAVIGAALAAPAAAQAAVPVESDCVTGWYVNDDEAALAPVQTAEGFLLDGTTGTKLVHHAVGPLDLADVKAGGFELAGATVGTMPLIKLETTAPYTTINQTSDGTFWATAMTYDQQGGQGHPVATVADLIGLDTKPGKPKLTSDTKVTTFGIGIDADNKATVSSVSFHGVKYDLTCKPTEHETTTATPKPSKTTSAPATVTPSASSSSDPAAAAVGGSAEPGLPVTGVNGLAIGGAAVFLLALGGLLFLAARERRKKFTA